ncbi:hypothetical protein DDB_G0274235 [Dictyostelium discoideum AX4]|uniref:Uncharacterized protein n=1 Tax=Dictyostelium discoideum TaxID=44689 RepID=Q8T292_DICDI|nr:hypothetical protein DDB_G0274235 [Dictyostelium discoideum AX4]EAL70010.1 hypothetical protein DDB_G0274235 [Dictyostelium discoideum AX4]|eukprot:XP_644237.1 hypothetical protein DDB_G0274235 [Dictyostelium discoideum AX4]
MKSLTDKYFNKFEISFLDICGHSISFNSASLLHGGTSISTILESISKCPTCSSIESIKYGLKAFVTMNSDKIEY